MNYIVTDFEFNQPFHFKTGFQTTLHPDCPFEIIQIGAVKLDEQFHILDKFNIFIKPVIYPRIHPYVEKITHLNKEQLEKQGTSFQNAYTSFIHFIGKEENILCTWGGDDIKLLFKNILYYQLDASKICNCFINVQKFASMYLCQESGRAIGLKNAVVELDLKIERPFHNALNDAIYTAKVFEIVHPNAEEIKPEICQITEKSKKTFLHTRGLLEYFEKTFGRALTAEEKILIKKAYKLGKKRAFDIPQKTLE